MACHISITRAARIRGILFFEWYAEMERKWESKVKRKREIDSKQSKANKSNYIQMLNSIAWTWRKKITNRHLCVVLVIAKKLPHIEVSLIALCQCKQRQKLGIQFAVQFKWLMWSLWSNGRLVGRCDFRLFQYAHKIFDYYYLHTICKMGDFNYFINQQSNTNGCWTQQFHCIDNVHLLYFGCFALK